MIPRLALARKLFLACFKRKVFFSGFDYFQGSRFARFDVRNDVLPKLRDDCVSFLCELQYYLLQQPQVRPVDGTTLINDVKRKMERMIQKRVDAVRVSFGYFLFLCLCPPIQAEEAIFNPEVPSVIQCVDNTRISGSAEVSYFKFCMHREG